MDTKNTRGSFLMALAIAFFVFLAGLIYIMVDVQLRIGRIEHYIVHHVYRGGLESSHGPIDKPWEQYRR